MGWTNPDWPLMTEYERRADVAPDRFVYEPQWADTDDNGKPNPW